MPKTQTEAALWESLKQLELQCKERVDLLEALRASKKDAEKRERKGSSGRRRGIEKGKSFETLQGRSSSGWLGDQTVPPMQYSDLPAATPALPPRPPMPFRNMSDASNKERAASLPTLGSGLGLPPTLPVPSKQVSRSPSPDPNRRGMKTTLRSEKRGFRSPRTSSNQPRRQAPMKAAGLAWDTRQNPSTAPRPDSDPTIEARLSATAARRSLDTGPRPLEQRKSDYIRMPEPQDYLYPSLSRQTTEHDSNRPSLNASVSDLRIEGYHSLDEPERPPPPPPHSASTQSVMKARTQSPPRVPKPPVPELSYRREYPKPQSNVPPSVANNILDKAYNRSSSGIARKPLASGKPPIPTSRRSPHPQTSESEPEAPKKVPQKVTKRAPAKRVASSNERKPITPPSTSPEHSSENDNDADDTPEAAFDKRSEHIVKHLPRGIDPVAARSILNEIIVRGDEVHWEDVAGLELAKTALKEAVVYPFLRPDLFLGLREPARGMLLFGPPGTGKTMLARAVATESKSTFFAISASSLTSKWHGESEKLVRALFAMAKVMSPSIIFVDEIDSLLSKRGEGSEHEASRRAKTEFLIQWSDLQKAAQGAERGKGKEEEGDPTRVLVLAATNCPWDIDDAARRRFVRRQYIPLPEDATRAKQLGNLVGHQKHDLRERDMRVLVQLTDGKSSYSRSVFTS